MIGVPLERRLGGLELADQRPGDLDLNTLFIDRVDLFDLVLDCFEFLREVDRQARPAKRFLVRSDRLELDDMTAVGLFGIELEDILGGCEVGERVVAFSPLVNTFAIIWY